MVEYKQNSHSVWDVKYHVIWVTKYRFKVLRGEVAVRLRDLLRQVCQGREVVGMVDAALDFSFSIWIAHFAGQRRHTVVCQNIAIQRVHARIVEVWRQYALAKVIQDYNPRRTAKPVKCLFMQLGPYPRTRTEDQQANTLPTTTQC